MAICFFVYADADEGSAGPSFETVATGSRIEVPTTLIRAPRTNAFCERFFGSIRRDGRECPERE